MIGNLCQDWDTAAFVKARDALSNASWRGGQALDNLKYVAGPAMNALASAGVHTPTLVVKASGLGMAAMFFPNRWEIDGSPQRYGETTIDDDVLRTRAAKIYHEARHVEQFFLAARLITTKLSRKESLTTHETDLIGAIPAAVRDAAAKQTLTTTDAEAAEIGAWISDYANLSTITAELALARSELAKLATQIEKDTPKDGDFYGSQDKCDEAATMLAKHTSLANFLRNSFKDAFTKYLKQATEVDAYAVGRMVGAADPDAEQATKALYEQTVEFKLRWLTGRVNSKIELYRDRLTPPAPATTAPTTTTPTPPTTV